MPNLLYDPNSKISLWNATALQYSRKHFKQKRFLESAPGKNVLFDFFKAKNEEKLQKIDFFFVQVKNHLANFGGLK